MTARSKVERYICTEVVDGKVCGKEFEGPRALGIHKASHDRERVKCPRCGKTVMYLETHMRKVHSVDTKKLLADFIQVIEENEHLRAENTELRRLLRE